MTDRPNPRPDTRPAPDPARARFAWLMLLRLAGVLVAILGLVLLGNRIALADPDSDRALGAALVVGGIVTCFILPVFVARRWKSPPAS